MSRGERGKGRSGDLPAEDTRGGLLKALQDPEALRTVELRPPSLDPGGGGSIEAWIDLNRAVRALLGQGRFVLFTDAAVGAREEESLQHLRANLGQNANLSRVVPFLTCKHTLDYCLLFARRALAVGMEAITVTGGDPSVGPPRCVPRSRELRRLIRERVPSLRLGAWVNPQKDSVEQVDLLRDPEHNADYYVTQVVSHHHLGPLDGFLNEGARRGLDVPGLVGVFFYRSPSTRTLDRLERFIPVPREGLLAEFREGSKAENICARTLRALAARGVKNTYVSNLAPRRALAQLDTIERGL